MYVLQPVGLAVHGQYVYWIDRETENVLRVNKEGKERSTIQANIDKLSDLVAVNKTRRKGQ